MYTIGSRLHVSLFFLILHNNKSQLFSLFYFLFPLTRTFADVASVIAY
jgi:hypothetical protein